MKVIICLVVLVVAVSARPQFIVQRFHKEPVALVTKPVIPIIDFNEKRDDSGQFSLSYTGGNGATETRRGYLKLNADGTDYVLVQEGTFSFIGDDGVTKTVKYTADEDGFHATGDHLPKD